jgi:hypothetical protein
METVATDNNGSYASVTTPANLKAVEASIPTEEVNGAAFLSTAEGTEEGKGWKVVATSGKASGDTFTITRNSLGEVTRTCTEAGKGGCSGGKW